jgi:hypothetical protein
MLYRSRQWRRNGEVESRMKSDGLVDDSEIAIEMLDLTA